MLRYSHTDMIQGQGHMREPLFDILEHRGIKASWLADRAGISKALLSKAKKNERRIPDYARPRISAALGLPESVLFLAPVSNTVEASSVVVEESSVVAISA